MSDLDDEYEQSAGLDEEDWDDTDVSENLDDASFVCEDCDYRWEEYAMNEDDETSMVCPMCGSINVTLL
ncbi:MAG: hypothetical protein KDK39_19430 [Leptospiraceae bacterium]|nr:hypothetical protein [Leptospiraceae bacterium]